MHERSWAGSHCALRTGRSTRLGRQDRLSPGKRIFSDMGAFGPSVHALPVTVGHSRPGRGVTGWPAGSRRQPVFGSRARVPMCGRRVRGCRRDGWPGCCGQQRRGAPRTRRGPHRQVRGSSRQGQRGRLHRLRPRRPGLSADRLGEAGHPRQGRRTGHEPALGLEPPRSVWDKGTREPQRDRAEYAGGPSPGACAPSRPGERLAHDRTFALH
jgi:hypothetical protein